MTTSFDPGTGFNTGTSFHPGALLGASYPLAHGTRVRLRLAASSDAPRIWALLKAQGRVDAELQAARLTRFDPRTEVVILRQRPDRRP